MIFLMEGTETYRMNQAKHQLIQKSEADKENIITIDGSNKSNFQMENVITLCNTTSLFGDRRVIVLDSPYFLKTKKGGETEGTKKKNPIADLLETYCNNPCETTDLIIYCFGYDVDKRVKEYKILSSYFNKTVEHRIFSQMSIYELNQEIDRTFQQHDIHLTKEARQEFNERIDGNTTQFFVAMDKLLLYGKKNLEIEDIEHLVSVNTEINVWKFTDAFLRKNPTQMMHYLEELITIEHMSYTGIIPLLSYRLRTVYKAVKCHELGMSVSAIEKYTNKRNIDKDLQSANGYLSSDLLKLLYELANLDQNIKSGQIEERLGFEAFLYDNME